MLSKEAIIEFKEIYKKQYGRDISDEDAQEHALRTLTLFRNIYKPMLKPRS